MFLDRLICRIFGHRPWAVDRDDCSRCGEELPGLGPKGMTSVSATGGDPFDDKAFYVPGLMLPWWFGTHGPAPPGWAEPEAAVEVWSLWDAPATKSVTIPGKNWVITAEYQGKRR